MFSEKLFRKILPVSSKPRVSCSFIMHTGGSLWQIVILSQEFPFRIFLLDASWEPAY